MILCTGASGMVGSYINWPNVIRTDIDTLDVTNIDHLKRYELLPLTHVIHLAAETDLERCEKEIYHAYKVNSEGTRNMVQFAKSKNIPIIYISTAGIFNGTKKKPYVETDKPCPINVYGCSKLDGETPVKLYTKHYIFRAGWMMGGVDKDKKFVKKIIRQIQAGQDIIYGITDIWGSPTYAYDLTCVIKDAIEKKIPYGTYNASGAGRASRFHVAKEICRIMKYKGKVVPIHSSKFHTKDQNHPCVRSTNEMLDLTKLNKAGLSMRDWKVALRDYMQEWQ